VCVHVHARAHAHACVRGWKRSCLSVFELNCEFARLLACLRVLACILVLASVGFVRLGQEDMRPTMV
jgi:hypothetical protein